jgi:hypothetical protein
VSSFSKQELFRIVEKYVDHETISVLFSVSYFKLGIQDQYDSIDSSYPAQLKFHLAKRIAIYESYQKTAYPPLLLWPYGDDALLELREECKRHNPNIMFGAGGTIIKNILTDTPLRLSRLFDTCFCGYAENSIKEYVDSIKDGKRPLATYSDATSLKHFDFNASQLVWHESDYIFEGEVLPIEISRGCIFKCKFCSFPLNGKTKFDYIKNPDSLYEEFMRNYELFGTTRYMFSDDTFNDSTYKLQMLWDNVVSKLPFKIEFFAYLRLDLIMKDQSQIKLLKQLGIRYVKFGIESLNTETIRFIGKGFNLSDIIETLDVIKKEWKDDVVIDASFIFGLPRETKESLEFRRDWMINEGMKYFNSYSMYPLYLRIATDSYLIDASDISLNAEKYNYIVDNKDGQHWNWYNSEFNMSFSDMVDYIKDIKQRVFAHSNNRVGNHTGLSMENLGLDFNYMSRTSRSSLEKNPEIIQIHLRKILNYKTKVL